ncbi:transposase [Nonomuraea sp. NPDC050394]|uniref:transposase n=1 Tax=Nonomuraea sp. NPDC050394 TaxID=3364363 RepID=UPI0037A1E653
MALKDYSEEFRADAVALYESTEGATYKGIAADLGVSRGSLREWVLRARAAQMRRVRAARAARLCGNLQCAVAGRLSRVRDHGCGVGSSTWHGRAGARGGDGRGRAGVGRHRDAAAGHAVYPALVVPWRRVAGRG